MPWLQRGPAFGLASLSVLCALVLMPFAASAQPVSCPCSLDVPRVEPTACYEMPGPGIADSAFIAPSDFVQVVGLVATPYCRHNSLFISTDPAATLACEAFIGCLCDNPSLGPEILCNDNDDDCDAATSDGAPQEGGIGADTLIGGSEEDCLDGGAGGDDLDGGPDRDVLEGGPGNDSLAGGPDDDFLDGGPDYDCAIFDGNLANFDFEVAWPSGILVIDTVGAGGKDRAVDIECFQFDDATVTPGANAPIDILLSNATLEDGDPAGTPVGDLAAIDPDIVDAHTFSLVPGPGDADNASFQIVGKELRSASAADSWTQSSYDLRIQAEDLAGASFEKEFTVVVNPPAAPPVCPCAAGVPLVEPAFCYERPGPAVADFAIIHPGHFLQVVDLGLAAYCRHNASFVWTGPAITLACEAFIGCLCGNPSPGAELICNGNDDDCNPATPDQTAEVCDNGIDDDCDGDTDAADADCDQPPTAVDDTATVLEDNPATAIDVLGNDNDPDGGPKSIVSVTQPPNGSVVITGGGSGLTYQPDPDFCNDGVPTDDFTYTLTPGGSVATVAVTVPCVNTAPTADPDTATTLEDTPVVITLTGSDPEGDPLTFIPGPDPAGGTLSGLTPTGPTSADITYTPDPNFCNDGVPPDDFTFTVDDGSLSSPPATIAVTVTCVNDPPM